MTARKWSTNPFVTLVPERLRAAMADGGWDDVRLARAISSDPRLRHAIERQNIRHLATRPTESTRCRAERRAALAAVLNISEEWLGGVDVWLPLMPQLQLSLIARTSPRVALALQRFLGECHARYSADLERKEFRAQDDDPSQIEPSAYVLGALLHALVRLATPEAWRVRLDTLPRGASDHPSKGTPEAKEREDAALGLLAAWRSILGPWLSGQAPLHYGALGELTRWLFPSFAAEPSAALPERITHRVTRRRRVVRDQHHPLAFLQWPLLSEPDGLSET